jgi:hypothetical protein
MGIRKGDMEIKTVRSFLLPIPYSPSSALHFRYTLYE